MRFTQVLCPLSFISTSYGPQTKTWSPRDGGHCWCGAGDCWLDVGLDCYWQELYYCTHTHTHKHTHTRTYTHTHTHTQGQYLAFRRVACSERVSCRNACRMGSSKSSFVTKSCPRPSAEFLARFTFRSGDSMCTCIYCVFCIVSFMYNYSYSFCLY